MAANGNSGNGNTSTGQSAASAQAAAAAGNAAASNAANSGNNTSTGNTSTSTGATNSAGLMGSLMSFGNSITGNVGNTYGGGGGSTANNNDNTPSEGLFMGLVQQFINAENARKGLPSEVADVGDEAYTKARAEGKTEAEAQKYARKAVTTTLKEGGYYDSVNLLNGFAFRGKNTGPTYNPATTAMATTNPTIAKGSSEMGPSTANNAPGNIGGETGGGIAGGTESGTESAAPSVSDATNTGVTYRGGTVTNGGTSVTDSGTGGSISSGVNAPSRDASSIGLGVYNTDRANYDQDNWNRGMEAESSSLVSDEECKAFAKRAFMENSEPFKKVRISIIKKC